MRFSHAERDRGGRVVVECASRPALADDATPVLVPTSTDKARREGFDAISDLGPAASPAYVIDFDQVSRRVWIACVGLIGLLFVLDAVMNYAGAAEIGALRRLFNTAREDSLAAWFQNSQTLAASVLCLAVAFVTRRRSPRSRASGFFVLAAFFAFMAIDDSAKIHERLGTASKHLIAVDRSGFPSYAWQLVVLPALAAMGLFMCVFLWRDLTRFEKGVLAFAVGLFAFAVGLDFIEGLSPLHPWNLAKKLSSYPSVELFSRARFERSGFDTVRHFSKSLEECLEMLGISTMCVLFVRRLGRSFSNLEIRSASP